MIRCTYAHEWGLDFFWIATHAPLLLTASASIRTRYTKRQSMNTKAVAPQAAAAPVEHLPEGPPSQARRASARYTSATLINSTLCWTIWNGSEILRWIEVSFNDDFPFPKKKYLSSSKQRRFFPFNWLRLDCDVTVRWCFSSFLPTLKRMINQRNRGGMDSKKWYNVNRVLNIVPRHRRAQLDGLWTVHEDSDTLLFIHGEYRARK